MSTHSTPSPTASALNLDSPLLLQPDPDPRTTSHPIDSMPSDDKRQSISHKPAESGSSEARSMKNSSTSGLKFVDEQDGTQGRPVEQTTAPSVSSNTPPATTSTTNTPLASHGYATGGKKGKQRDTAVDAAPMLPSDNDSTTPTTPSQRAQNMTGQDKQASPPSSGGVPAPPSATQAQMPSLSDGTPQDGWKELVDIQRQLLDVLTKMNKKLDGQDEEDEAQRAGGGTGAQPHKEHFKETLLGIPKQRFDHGQQFNPLNEDYEQRFPEDPYGEEAGPNARVFRVYNEEAAVYDADMIGQCSDSSDVLLVFAGLFSAVLTTFVAQTSQALDPDTGAISISLLSEIVHLLRAQEDGTSFGEVQPAITETTPTGNDLWVNGLWFTSLTLSLATALFAVLTKQWLRQYMRKTSGTIRDRSLIRQFRFAGMEKWHVTTIIGILPILLHLALGVFLVGLIVFLFPRSLPLACVVMGITVLIYSLYFVSNLLPVLDIQCPYRTPFSDILNILYHPSYFSISTLNMLMDMLNFICKHLHRVLPFIPQETSFHISSFNVYLKLLGTRELEQVQRQSDNLSLNVIEWLTSTSSNPSVLTVGVEAIGGLPPSQRKDISETKKLSDLNVICDLIKNCLIFSDTETMSSCQPGYTRKLERLCCTFPLFRISCFWEKYLPCDIYPMFHDLKDVRGMVAALGLYRSKAEYYSTILPHLFDSSKSPKVTLCPAAWETLFKNLGNVEPVHRLDICKEVLESGNATSEIPAWEELTEPVSMSYAFNRAPEGHRLVLSAFRGYHPFQNLDFISQPPDSPHLHALLIMYYFLESETIPESLDIVSLLCSVWKHINHELHSSSTVHDCTVVFHTTSWCLLQSGLLKGNKWMLSEQRSNYCRVVLDTCDDALIYAPSALQGIQWNCTEQVAKITFTTGDVPSEDYITSTCKMAGQLWGRVLDRDIEDAYTSFIKFHVLGHQPSAFKYFDWLVPKFISGLLRQAVCPSPHPDWFMECKSYLHQSDNLLMACKILAEYRYSNYMYDELAQIDPENETREGCQEKLRHWHPDNDDRLPDFEDSLDALDKFFEKRHQHKGFLNRFNPAPFLRSVFQIRRNPSTPSSSGDIEMGPLTAPQVSSSQEATSSVVAGVSSAEQDGEHEDHDHSEGLVTGSQPLNGTDNRRSPQGLELTQDESTSLYYTTRELASVLSHQHVGEGELDRRPVTGSASGFVQDDVANENDRDV